MSVSLFPVFLVGLAGSVHCAGMCGGIVGALSLGRRGADGDGAGLRQPAFPVPVQTRATPGAARAAARSIDTMRACPRLERTNTACSWPGRS